jgi:pentatricopeptide repeat protein
MNHSDVFQMGQVCEAADYFCEMVASGCSPNKDINQLMSALRTMAWVLEQLNTGSRDDAEVKHRLTQECTAVACHLLDRKCEMLTNRSN